MLLVVYPEKSLALFMNYRVYKPIPNDGKT